jgi:hypothetical protein
MAFDPTGKPFSDRLAAMIQDAKSTHGVTIGITSGGRTPQKQQTMHVAHMFLYNAYALLAPAHTEQNADGRQVIAWDYFSQANLAWDAGVRWQDFLRDAGGHACVKDDTGSAWAADHQPHKAQTQKQARSLLKDTFKVGNNGTAMAAAGLDGCGEPCKCGAHRSRHVEGLAADLNHLDDLEDTLQRKHAGSLDDYLSSFGLYRPLKDLPTSTRELWHVEATKD